MKHPSTLYEVLGELTSIYFVVLLIDLLFLVLHTHYSQYKLIVYKVHRHNI